jgi:hypothetical protein
MPNSTKNTANKPVKKPAASPVPAGDRQAEIANRLFASIRKHLAGNNLPKNYQKQWRDEVIDFQGIDTRFRQGRIIHQWIMVGRTSLVVTVADDHVKLVYGRKPEHQDFVLADPNFERDVAEFLGKHFKCYFPTYWLGEKSA